MEALSEEWLLTDKKRKIFSAYFQHMYDITENFVLIGGLRYDDYNDMGNYLTPRISGVWRFSEHHILKAQYSESVRPPTFTELYSRGTSFIRGSEDLDSERIKSYETEYIWRKPGMGIRTTLFYSELEDKILYPAYADTFSSINIEYKNAQDTLKSRGAEIEFDLEMTKELQTGFNISYTDTNDGNGESIGGVSDWLANAWLICKPVQDYEFVLRYHYTGERHRDAEDPREDLKGFHVFDLTANVFNLFKSGLTLRAGVKNFFDTDIICPAPVYKDEKGITGYYYQDDFPRPGREWWMDISYEF
ncbi:TonB-dependent receptor domain-containing protein [Desulfonema magnum]|uniref:TonB-dependent receptor domain-containing protein n=2 Tax=Desulfonema magnum TaxID=45655 RepID=A0A975BGQ2_9BACT|nr:TonB-dependent receptor domain-containing protein [Desulfonema magnum]